MDADSNTSQTPSTAVAAAVPPPSSHAAIIDAFGGPGTYAEAIGIADSHARAMKTRDSISPAYWRPTAGAARVRNIPGVTFERIAEIAAIAAEARLALSTQVARGAS